MARSTVNDRLDALDVGLPSSVGTSVGMGDFDTESDTLTAKIALCHLLHLLAIKEYQDERCPKAPEDMIPNNFEKSKSKIHFFQSILR